MIRDSVVDWQELSKLYEQADLLEEPDRSAWLAELREEGHRLLAAAGADARGPPASREQRLPRGASEDRRAPRGDAGLRMGRRPPDRSLSAGPSHRPGRHGRGVAGRPGRWCVLATGRDQAAVPSRVERRGRRFCPALRARAGHPGVAAASAHRRPARRRRDAGWTAVARARVRRRPADHDLVRCQADVDPGPRRGLSPGVDGGAARAQEPRHPSRPQASQHSGDRRRTGPPPRFRDRQAARARRRCAKGKRADASSMAGR